jgi:3-keto-L-gulonate-6-phosphate decarboxylase
MSATDVFDGGMTIDDTAAFAEIIDGKIDVFHVSNGLKVKGNRTGTFSDMYDPHGLNIDYSRKIKSRLKSTKVAVIGGLNAPEQCEAIIASGAADLVVLGRQAFADPDFANKTISGKTDEIRRCVRCCQCYPGIPEHETDVDIFHDLSPEESAKATSPASMGKCSINPHSNLGLFEEHYPAMPPHKVLVIGGGVAGMQAALSATERGHSVTLIEKNGKLGGIVNFTDFDECKVDLCNFKNTLVRLVERSGAEVRLNTEFSADLLSGIKPDVIIIAIGSKPKPLPIDGIEHAVDAIDLYKNIEKLSEHVAVIGGGITGCETAIALAKAGKSVTVLEMGQRLAPTSTGIYRVSMLDEMDKLGVKYFTDGKGAFDRADTTINACGMSENDTKVIEKLCGDIPTVKIGDCSQVGNVGTAIQSAHFAILELNNKTEVSKCH